MVNGGFRRLKQHKERMWVIYRTQNVEYVNIQVQETDKLQHFIIVNIKYQILT